MRWLKRGNIRQDDFTPLSSRRRVIGLIAGGIVLIMGANLALVGEPEESATNPGRSAAITSFFTAADIDSLDRIVVTPPSGTPIDLRRSGPNWLILDGERSIPISADRAARLLTTSAGEFELQRDMFASLKAENPANHALVFGVSASNAIHVEFFRGQDRVEDFLVGKISPQENGVGTFVRRPDENAVFLVEGNLRDNFHGNSIADWRDQKPLSALEPSDVEAIRVTSVDGATGYELRRDLDNWRISWAGGDAIADPELAAGAAREVSSLHFINFETSSQADAGETSQGWNVRVRTTTGEVLDFNLWSPFGDNRSTCFAALSHVPLAGQVFFPYALLRNPAEFTVEPSTARVAAGGAVFATSMNG